MVVDQKGYRTWLKVYGGMSLRGRCQNRQPLTVLLLASTLSPHLHYARMLCDSSVQHGVA